MHAVNLLAPALISGDFPAGDFKALPAGQTRDGVCALTGQFGPCLPREHVLGPSFTNLDLLAAPASRLISRDAAIVLGCKWERMSSWFCDGKTFQRLDRQGVRRLVIQGEYPVQWAGYATTSYKKHGALWTPVNTGHQAVWRFENTSVDCGDQARLLDCWTRLNTFLRAGVSRPVLESLEPTSYALRAVGPDGWLRFLRWARPLYKSALYQFLCYLLPSQEELKSEQN